MKKYEFTLVLSGSLELTDDIADALFSAGCDDATPGTHCGEFVIDFRREGDSLEQAICSAIRDVQTAGYTVALVEIEADALAPSV